MKFLNVAESEKILIVAPHPDDECIGVGGLLALYPKQCHVLIMTDGRIGQSNYSEEDTIKIRKNELESELGSIGITYEYMDVPDGMLSKHIDILDNYDLSNYSKIFVTSPKDGHPDHTAAFLCVRSAIKKQQNLPDIYLYEVHNPIESPTHMLNITSVIGKKTELIKCHKSQIKAVAYDNMALSLSIYRAIQNRMRDANIEVYELCQNFSYEINPLELELQKQRLFYKILTNWIDYGHKGWNLGKELKKRGYRSIGIYGYAELGKLAAYEVENEENIDLKVIFDKKANQFDDKRIKYPNTLYEDIDCVMVTAVYYFDEIKEELSRLGYTNIKSIKEMVEGV